jgi:hypothetical protein
MSEQPDKHPQGMTTREAELMKNNGRLLKYFRNTFCSPEGRAVFLFIVTELGLFDDRIMTEGKQALRNYAVTLMKRMGMGKVEVLEHSVNSLLEVASKLTFEDKEG